MKTITARWMPIPFTPKLGTQHPGGEYKIIAFKPGHALIMPAEAKQATVIIDSQ